MRRQMCAIARVDVAIDGLRGIGASQRLQCRASLVDLAAFGPGLQEGDEKRQECVVRAATRPLQLQAHGGGVEAREPIALRVVRQRQLPGAEGQPRRGEPIAIDTLHRRGERLDGLQEVGRIDPAQLEQNAMLRLSGWSQSSQI